MLRRLLFVDAKRSVNGIVRRPFSSTTEPVKAQTEGSKVEQPNEELRKKLDDEEARNAEEKRKAVETRRLLAAGKMVERSTKPRVPEYIKPWQKVWFPNERIILVKPKELDVTATKLVFRMPPHLTKHEIKDMLEAVYGFDVRRVATVNRMGKVKYPAGFSLVKGKAYKRPDFKQVYVFLNSPDLRQQPSNQRSPVVAAPSSKAV